MSRPPDGIDPLELRAEIDAAAQSYADAVFEPLAKQVNDDLNEKAVEAWEPLLDEAYVRDVILPLFKRELFSRLSEKCAVASGGWDTVHWQSITRNHTGE